MKELPTVLPKSSMSWSQSRLHMSLQDLAQPSSRNIILLVPTTPNDTTKAEKDEGWDAQCVQRQHHHKKPPCNDLRMTLEIKEASSSQTYDDHDGHHAAQLTDGRVGLTARMKRLLDWLVKKSTKKARECEVTRPLLRNTWRTFWHSPDSVVFRCSQDS